MKNCTEPKKKNNLAFIIHRWVAASFNVRLIYQPPSLKSEATYLFLNCDPIFIEIVPAHKIFP